MTMIEARNLTKRFGETVAVDGVDLTVEEGSAHGLVGPNGAGKTTAMQLIIGLLSPTAGEVSVAGEPAGSKAAKRHIGYSPQELALYESMTGREYLEFMGKIAGMDSEALDARVEEVVDWVELGDAADRPTGDYSGGMRQRVSLAQAMLHEPDLLVLDEPTSGLDPTGRQRVMDTIEGLPAEGMTVFVSSHVLSELEQYVDSVTVLRDGEKVMTDAVDSVQATYGGGAFAVETDDDEAARELVAAIDVVRTVEVEDDQLLVMTDDPDAFRRELQQELVEHGISLRSLSEEGTLQEAFADIVAGDEEVDG
jgi:ABC-2 type transport system ATP-binding protein